MKKLYTVFSLLIAIALAAFTMTACLGGDNLPNNPKGQVMNKPASQTIESATPANPPAEGGAPAAGGEQPAAPAGGDDEDEDMPGGGE